MESIGNHEVLYNKVKELSVDKVKPFVEWSFIRTSSNDECCCGIKIKNAFEISNGKNSLIIGKCCVVCFPILLRSAIKNSVKLDSGDYVQCFRCNNIKPIKTSFKIDGKYNYEYICITCLKHINHNCLNCEKNQFDGDNEIFGTLYFENFKKTGNIVCETCKPEIVSVCVKCNRPQFQDKPCNCCIKKCHQCGRYFNTKNLSNFGDWTDICKACQVDNSHKPITKTCKICNKEFETIKLMQLYCSPECVKIVDKRRRI